MAQKLFEKMFLLIVQEKGHPVVLEVKVLQALKARDAVFKTIVITKCQRNQEYCNLLQDSCKLALKKMKKMLVKVY